jgi:hypothetical protein
MEIYLTLGYKCSQTMGRGASRNPVCQIANYLYEGAKALGGHMEVCTFFNTFPCIFLFILVVFSKYVVRKTADVCVFYKNLTTAK